MTQSASAYSDLAALRHELKAMIVHELNLEGRTPESIDDSAPIFGEGLGLDSLDALQLAMAVEEHYGVRIPEGPEGRSILTSIVTLAEYVAAQRGSEGAPSPSRQGQPGEGS